MVAAVLSAVAAAQAPPLVPRWDPGAVRAFKVDLFAFRPGLHPWGSDWNVTTVEQWTAVVECTVVRERTEACTFPEGVWFGAVVEGSRELTSVRLAPPGTIELSWTERGRLASWDVLGNRQAFWDDASNTFLRLAYRRADVEYRPDARREIGGEIEGALVRQIAGALEWELPKKGEAKDGWRATATPWAARRYTQSVSNASVDLSVKAVDAGAVQLAMDGRAGEASAALNTIAFSVQTRIVGEAVFDPASGRVVRSRTEALHISSQGPLVGHTQFITLAVPWSRGDPATPADMPEPSLAP